MEPLNRFTSRFLERRDLLEFLSGHLLGFALDDFFDGAYLGAFDERGEPAGFIFTGHEREDREILIGVPHSLHQGSDNVDLERFLVREAVRNARTRADTIVAAVYSDQSREEMVRLQEIYRQIGFRYSRDSTILSRSLEGVEPPDLSMRTIGFDVAGSNRMASIARDCAGSTAWSGIDFTEYISIWSKGVRFDADLFRIAMIEGEPAGVMMARLDSLDPREGGFYFLGVLPHFRRRGLGGTMLQLGLSLLRDKGAVRTRQTIPASDGPALRLLEDAGYQVAEWARYFQLSGSRSAPGGGMR